MERAFRVDVGDISATLCIVDVALRRYCEEVRKSQDITSTLVGHGRLFGHRLFPAEELDLGRAVALSAASQIAYLFARLDVLCTKIRNHPLIFPGARETAKGDFLSKTIHVVLISRRKEVSNPPKSDEVGEHLSISDLRILHYYRLNRNEELHDEGASAERHAKLLEELGASEREKCRKQFGALPAPVTAYSFSDVLLFSKLCQSLALSLCRFIVDPELDLIPEVRHRFGHLPPARRANAARALLTQMYLLDRADADAIIADAW